MKTTSNPLFLPAHVVACGIEDFVFWLSSIKIPTLSSFPSMLLHFLLRQLLTFEITLGYSVHPFFKPCYQGLLNRSIIRHDRSVLPLSIGQCGSNSCVPQMHFWVSIKHQNQQTESHCFSFSSLSFLNLLLNHALHSKLTILTRASNVSETHISSLAKKNKNIKLIHINTVNAYQ